MQGRKKDNSLKQSHKKSILNIIESKNTNLYDLKGKDLMNFDKKNKFNELQQERLAKRKENIFSSQER